ncbi:MAG TPA: hypothetical protein VMU26_28765 [Candidatus Polarisedimenticolia bacterium]|nr:hypothetical protein [Candidatus Polarisedimenticolia bacterium]
MDQKQAGITSVPPARPGQSTNGSALWDGLTYNLQPWIQLRKLQAAAA